MPVPTIQHLFYRRIIRLIIRIACVNVSSQQTHNGHYTDDTPIIRNSPTHAVPPIRCSCMMHAKRVSNSIFPVGNSHGFLAHRSRSVETSSIIWNDEKGDGYAKNG